MELGRDRGGDVDVDAESARLAVVPDDDLKTQLQDLAPSNPGRTLLPGPMARAVSFATRSTGLALRMGTVIGGYGFDAAKVTTLSSLEIGRAILGGILGRAGKDVITRSASDLGKADAESVLEKSLENLHRTMTQIVFWTTTGFHMTETTFAMISETSQLLLSTLDQFFGSTDSSRAMASIITLIRREFQNPATGVQGEKVGVLDLMLGLCGMASLQRWCRPLLEEESRNLRIEEVVWDVVVFSDGARVGVHEESLYGIHNGRYGAEQDHGDETSLLHKTSNGEIVATIENHGAQDSEDDRDGVPEIRLKRQIMKSLPDNAKVSITTQISTTKTITVDITGGVEDLRVSPPPGVELIEESSQSRPPGQAQSHIDSIPPTCRVVYRLHRDKERRTSFKKEDGDISQVAGYLDQVDNEPTDGSATEVEARPSKPPKRLSSRMPTSVRRRSSTGSTASNSSTTPVKASRIPTIPKAGVEHTANQKRPRIPLSPSTTPNSRPTATSRRQSANKFPSSRNRNGEDSDSGKDKKGGFRNVLKRPASFFNKEDSGSETSGLKKKGKQRSVSHTVNKPSTKVQPKYATLPAAPSPASHLAVTGCRSSLIPRHSPKRPSAPGSRTNSGSKTSDEPYVRSPSRTSYISVHERRRDSMISQTDTYSITPADDYGPVSPCTIDDEDALDGENPMKRDMSSSYSIPAAKGHRRVTSHMYSPSIYTLSMNESSTSLVPYMVHQKSAFGDTEAMGTLRRAGMVEGMFPKHHILRNITRFMRFASASYGSNFLKVLGIAKEMPLLRALDDTHHELRSFAHHTQSDTGSILLSSFVDPQGGSDGTGSTNTGVPLVHYISLDHESKAVVLACRGTLGFEDVLADMTCDYDDLHWRGKPYKVHKGIHASAQRLLYGGDGRVLYTLKQALEEFTDYGLVLTGHSLGGAVTALLGVMLSEPAPGATSFMTSADPHTKLLLGDGTLVDSPPPRHVCLPSGRPVHVFAYGPPSTMSASLCKATRGLITSIVNGNDMVPYLSLGVLHDFQAVALAFKTDNNEAKVEVRQRIKNAFQSGIADRWYGFSGSDSGSGGIGSLGGMPFSGRRNSTEGRPSPTQGPDGQTQTDNEQWAYAALKVLRASMMSQKLLPPGEVFVVESTRVLRRDAFMMDDEMMVDSGDEDDEEEGSSSTSRKSKKSRYTGGRPAQRVVLKYVRDVEKRFREVRFGTSMLTDHSPGKYEDALNKLQAGVMDSPA